MKKRSLVFALGLVGLLAACGGESSSSSSSFSSEISSIPIVAPQYGRLNLMGDFDVDAIFTIGDNPTDVRVDFRGVDLKIKTDTEIERVGDALDYTYYQVSNLIGRLSFDSVVMTAKQGRATLTYDFGSAAVDFYLLKGDFYIDLSGLAFDDADLSSFGINPEDLPNGKTLIKDAVSFLNDEKFRSLADVLSLGLFGMDTILNFAQQDEAIGNALSMERFSDEEFLVTFMLTSDSLAALVAQFSSDAGSEVKTAIENAISFVEGTNITALYNVKSQEMSNIGIHGGIIPNLSALSEGEEESFLKEITISANATVFTDSVEDFNIPELEGYQEYTPSQPQDSQASEE